MKNNINYEEYLKLKNGPRDLVDACICSVIRSVFVNKTDFPIYGISGPLDSKNDFPKDRL